MGIIGVLSSLGLESMNLDPTKIRQQMLHALEAAECKSRQAWALVAQNFTFLWIPGPKINKARSFFNCISTRTQIDLLLGCTPSRPDVHLLLR